MLFLTMLFATAMQLERVVFSQALGQGFATAEPGSTFQAELVELHGSVYPFAPTPLTGVDVEWSIDPVDGVAIDKSGRVTVAPGVKSGTQYTLSASLDHGARVVTIPLWVYTPGSNPLVGYWMQTATIPCDGSADAPVLREDQIQELVFKIDGGYYVTWQPFEIRKDYWGVYRTDGNRLSITIEHGNYVPDDVRKGGSFAITDLGNGRRQLRLRGLWLGTRRDALVKPEWCGMVFEGRSVR